ncbi:hypothetical protein BHM03_00032226, partial [Ensete ventricosum]
VLIQMFFPEINPMAEVPAIVHGDLKLFESCDFSPPSIHPFGSLYLMTFICLSSHAILCYLASAFPGVPDHW